MKEKTEIILLILVVGALAILIPFASSYPDGLEKVAESLGVDEPTPFWRGLMPDYSFEAAQNPYVSTLFSGLIGTAIVFTLTFIIGKAASKPN